MFNKKISLAILTISSLILTTPNITLANTETIQQEETFQDLESHLPTTPIEPPFIFIAETKTETTPKKPDITVYNEYVIQGNEAIKKGLKTGNIYHYHTALINYDKALEIRTKEVNLFRAINNLELYLYDYHMRKGYQLVREAQKTRNYYYYQLALDNFTRATYRKSSDKYAKQAINNVQKYLKPDYLNQELKQAICAKNWETALKFIETMKQLKGRNYPRELDEYKARILYIINNNSQTPVYPPSSYCNSTNNTSKTEKGNE